MHALPQHKQAERVQDQTVQESAIPYYNNTIMMVLSCVLLYTLQSRQLWSYWMKAYQISTRYDVVTAAVIAPIDIVILQSVSECQCIE